MRSPGGLEFGLRPASTAVDDDVRVVADDGVVDQVCIDVPSDRFEEEATFWEQLTGWERRPGRLEEFSLLVPPSDGSFRILLQRLEDNEGEVRSHLDLACADRVRTVVQRHLDRGADVVRVRELWTTMRDPLGMEYCLTARQPPRALGQPSGTRVG